MFTLSILTERCTKAAARASGPEATAADVRLRGEAIHAFLMGFMRFPTQLAH